MTSPSASAGSINVTPLIDILLVLLIIFMVITPLSPHGIDAKLPENAAAAPARYEPEIVLEITHQREFLLNGLKVPRKDLVIETATLYRNRAERQLFIRADGDLEYRDVALAMDDTRGADSSVQFGILGAANR